MARDDAIMQGHDAGLSVRELHAESGLSISQVQTIIVRQTAARQARALELGDTAR